MNKKTVLLALVFGTTTTTTNDDERKFNQIEFEILNKLKVGKQVNFSFSTIEQRSFWGENSMLLLLLLLVLAIGMHTVTGIV